jgi:hypothetical protein
MIALSLIILAFVGLYLLGVQGVLLATVVIAAIASRPIELRLWRAGRISDQTTTVLLLGRLPVLILLYGLIQGYGLPFTLGVTALALLPIVLLYRPMLGLLRDQRPTNS